MSMKNWKPIHAYYRISNKRAKTSTETKGDYDTMEEFLAKLTKDINSEFPYAKVEFKIGTVNNEYKICSNCGHSWAVHDVSSCLHVDNSLVQSPSGTQIYCYLCLCAGWKK